MIAFVALLFVAQTFHKHAVLEGHNAQVSSVSFSFDDKMLATGSSDQTIKVWDVASARELSTLRGHEAAILSAGFSDKGTSLTSVDYRGKLIHWDRIDGVYQSSKSQVLEDIGDISKFDQQRFGKHAIFSSTKYVRDKIYNAKFPHWNLDILNTENPKNIITAKHPSSITSIAISSDGSLISFGDGQGVIRVLSRGDRGNLVEINSFTCPVGEDGDPATPLTIAFHPQNKFLAFGCDDSRIRLWKWSDAAPYATLVGHAKWINQIAISTYGDFFVSASQDRTLRIWSTRTRETLKSIQSATFVCSVSISENDKYIAYGDYNNLAHILSIDR